MPGDGEALTEAVSVVMRGRGSSGAGRELSASARLTKGDDALLLLTDAVGDNVADSSFPSSFWNSLPAQIGGEPVSCFPALR